MKRLLVVGLVLVSSAAWAGEAERAAKREAEKVLKEATDNFKTNCGCALKADVKWDKIKTGDQISQVKNLGNSLKDGADSFCKAKDDSEDAKKAAADNKKAICAMKSLEITNGKEADVKFASGKASIVLTDSSYVSWDMIQRAVDKD